MKKFAKGKLWIINFERVEREEGKEKGVSKKKKRTKQANWGYSYKIDKD